MLQAVEPEDLIKYGLIPEFVGRLPVVATLEELDEHALIQILTEPKNALIKQYQKLFAMEGVDLEVRPQGLTAIAERRSRARPARADCARFWSRSCWISCSTCPRWRMSARSSWTRRRSSARASRCSSTRISPRLPGPH